MAYLDSLDPPLGRTHAEDIARRRPKNKNWWGMTEITPLDDEHYKENYTGRTGLELLRRAGYKRPWFLVVNFNKPHPPMDITARMERLYRGPDRVIDGFPQPHNYTGPFPPEQQPRSGPTRHCIAPLFLAFLRSTLPGAEAAPGQ